MRGAKAAIFGATAALGLMATTGSTFAQTMPESCQRELAPMLQKRQAYIETINGYSKRKPTASQACGTFRNLAAHNEKMGQWMTSQKDWCQIPDDMLKQFTDAQGQINKTRNQICNAAAQQARQAKQAQQAGPRQPGVGSGVRLPQGAL